MTYSIYWARGDYRERQQDANEAKCVGFVEAHFNSTTSAKANYCLAIVGGNASRTSRNWAKAWTKAIAAEFGIPNGGVLVGPKRGDYNVRYTTMPAILLEPMFVSNPEQAEIAKSEDGQKRLARVLVDSIRRFFPDGGKVAFSVGHKFKRKRPNDRGAPVHGGGWEADLAESVLEYAAAMLTETAQPDDDRVIDVELNGRVICKHVADADAVVTWNAERETLVITEPAS